MSTTRRRVNKEVTVADYESMLSEFIEQSGVSDLGKLFSSLKRCLGKRDNLDGLHDWHCFYHQLYRIARSGRVAPEQVSAAVQALLTRKVGTNNNLKTDCQVAGQIADIVLAGARKYKLIADDDQLRHRALRRCSGCDRSTIMEIVHCIDERPLTARHGEGGNHGHRNEQYKSEFFNVPQKKVKIWSGMPTRWSANPVRTERSAKPMTTEEQDDLLAAIMASEPLELPQETEPELNDKDGSVGASSLFDRFHTGCILGKDGLHMAMSGEQLVADAAATTDHDSGNTANAAAGIKSEPPSSLSLDDIADGMENNAKGDTTSSQIVQASLHTRSSPCAKNGQKRIAFLGRGIPLKKNTKK